MLSFHALSGLVLSITLAGAQGAAAAAVYDAIAIDDAVQAGGNGDYAVGQGATKQDAQRIAMSNCASGGNLACTLKLTYDRCGAYAASSRASGVGTGGTLKAASEAAVAACNDSACRLVVTDCVDLPLRPPG